MLIGGTLPPKIKFLNSYPSSGSFERLVDNYMFKCIDTADLPTEITQNKLCQKFNSVLMAASGSDEGISYAVVGFRPDNNNTEMDEHPYLFYYDHQDSLKNFALQVDHGDWSNRTVSLEPWQTEKLRRCGITTDIVFKNIKRNTSGSLFDLYGSGSLVGISDMFSILDKEKHKKPHK